MKIGNFALLFVILVIQEAAASHMLVYGDVTIDGRPAPVGTIIVAKIVDVEVGNCITTEEGTYGILITTNESRYTPIDFYIGNSRAIQVVTFIPESVMMLDLDFTTETTTTIRKVEPPTTVVQEPGIIGRAISFTTNDGTIIGFIIVLVLIFYFIRDLL